MFCPICKAEYREGFVTCADCSVLLVPQLPQKEDQQHGSQAETPSGAFEGEVKNAGDLVEVFQTLDLSEVLIIKSILDEEGIPYHFSGDNFRMSAVLVSPARLLVPADLKTRVLEILKNCNSMHIAEGAVFTTPPQPRWHNEDMMGDQPAKNSRFFKQTRLAIKRCKEDPPEHTWNQGSQYTRFDFSWWCIQIVFYVAWIVLALMIDIILLPFQLIISFVDKSTQPA